MHTVKESNLLSVIISENDLKKERTGDAKFHSNFSGLSNRGLKHYGKLRNAFLRAITQEVFTRYPKSLPVNHFFFILDVPSATNYITIGLNSVSISL